MRYKKHVTNFHTSINTLRIALLSILTNHLIEPPLYLAPSTKIPLVSNNTSWSHDNKLKNNWLH